jgi:signal transduction histidine kinase/CheY-like chemotaxis protein
MPSRSDRAEPIIADQPEPAAAAHRLFDAVDALRYGLVLWDAEGRLIHCNRAFRELFHGISAQLVPGFTFEAFLRALLATGEITQPADRAEWMRERLAAFAEPQIEEHQLADGRTLEVIHDLDPSGSIMMTVQDVTTARRGEKALRKAKELAETADQTKSRFLRAANHDLRQPLSTMKILIFNCIDAEDAAHRDDLLHAMDISVSIMEDLLDALLQIGQLDAGRIVPKVTTFQLSQLFDRLKIQFAHVARDKGIDLRVVDTRVSIATDRALLERILSNLVANAIRYTDAGAVLLGARRAGGQIRIEVCDTGRGMAPEHLDRIFEEFYQIGEAKPLKSRGLGLGLNIVKRLSDLLGHRVSVSSAPARGSVFRLEVPTGNVWLSDMGEPLISEAVGGEFVGRCVYIIEDDPGLRQVLKNLLERWGMEAHALSGLDEAKALLASDQRPPDLIISDYSLRGEYGSDVVQKIQTALAKTVPSILMTADTDPELIRSLRDRSFPVLIKPVSPPRLRVLMHNLLYEPSENG